MNLMIVFFDVISDTFEESIINEMKNLCDKILKSILILDLSHSDAIKV